MDPLTIIGAATGISAVVAWIVTNLNILDAKKKLSNRVIQASAETRAAAIDTVNGMEKRVDASLAKIDAVVATLPKIDEESLAIDYEEMGENLKPIIGPMISEHINMAIHQMEAQRAKVTSEFLKGVGLDEALGDAEKQIREAALQEAGPLAELYNDIMSAKIPKRATIGEKAWLQTSKLLATQLVQSSALSQLGAQGQAAATVEQATPVRSGFGVR